MGTRIRNVPVSQGEMRHAVPILFLKLAIVQLMPTLSR